MSYFGRLVVTLPNGRAKGFELEKPRISLGSSVASDVFLDDEAVAPEHASITQGEDTVVLERVGAAGGMALNGVPVDRTELAFGDEFSLGACSLRFAAPGTPGDAVETVRESAPGLGTDLAALAHGHLTTLVGDTRSDRIAVVTPSGTREIALDDGVERLTIGRHSTSDVQLDLPGVSRHHARLERRGREVVLRDLGSRNGTWLGKQRIESRRLCDGDTVRIGKALFVFKRGFESDALFADDASFASPGPLQARGRSPVVVIPAMCGSELWRGGERVWPDVLGVIKDPSVLRYAPDNPLEPRAVLKDFCVVPPLIKLEQYGRLRAFLEQSMGYERGVDLLEFAYDWREDVRLSARRLARVLDDWPVFCKPPVTIVAHSLGCLIARYYVEYLGGRDKVDRLVLMGGPHHGVPRITTFIHSNVDVLPFGLRSQRLREAVLTFPSMYQVLPTYPCVIDQHGEKHNVLASDAWVPEVGRPLLADARALRRELNRPSSVPTLSVFGYGLKTVSGIRVTRADDGSWTDSAPIEGPVGDHTTPEYSAVLDPDHIHPVRQFHGSLYIDQDVQKRLKLELRR